MNMEQSWYRQFWPWFLIILPLSAVTASIYSLVIAFSQQDPVLRDTWYHDGELANQFLVYDHNATKHQIRTHLEYDSRTGLVSAIVYSHQPLPNQIEMELEHPYQAQLDQSIQLLKVSNNKYEGKLSSDISGTYYVNLFNVQQQWRLVAKQSFPFEQSAVITYGER